MKKTLLALTVLGAFAGSAMAADVTLYGKIDTGVKFTATDFDMKAANGQDDKHSFEMASGTNSGSRFGLKGTEDLGNGVKVGFVLENGFDSDDGSFDANGDDKMFGREAIVFLEGGFGKVAFGRMGIMNSTAGSFSMGNFTPFGTGWGNVGDQNMLWDGSTFATRWDNMISYSTPEFAGLKVTAQYSFGSETKDADGKVIGEEGKSSRDRYYGIGANYANGGLNIIAIVDSVNKKSYPVAGDVDDALRATFGGSYDFGFVKPFVAFAYVKDGSIKDFDKVYETLNGKDFGTWDSYGVSLGATAPVLSGTAYGMIGYMSAENQTDGGNMVAGDELDRWMVGVGYEYPLSKRTFLYADGGYMQDSYDFKDGSGGFDPKSCQFALGLVHNF